MAKHSTHKERNASEPYLQLMRWEYRSPAFQALSGDEVKVYMELRFRYNGRNNGQIVLSSRQAGDVIGKSFHTGARALLRLTELGFIKISVPSTYGQKRLSREYEITAIALEPAKKADRLPAGTKDFMRWTSEQITALGKATDKAKKTKHSRMGESHSRTHANMPAKVINLRAV